MPRQNNEADGTAKGSEANAGADNPPAPPTIPTPPPPAAEKPKRVRVITKGTLGPLLLKEGDETDDADYVAILKVKGQKKVVEVK